MARRVGQGRRGRWEGQGAGLGTRERHTVKDSNNMAELHHNTM